MMNPSSSRTFLWIVSLDFRGICHRRARKTRRRLKKTKPCTYSQAEVVLVLAVHGVGEVLVAGLRETVFLIQDVQDSQHLGLHQICRQRRTSQFTVPV